MIQSFLHNREVRHLLINFACLSFVPEADVVEEFEKLHEQSPDIMNGLYQSFLVIKILFFFIELTEFVDYFEDNYVGRRIRGTRCRSPRFAISFWNCFVRLDQQLPRTNNAQESWHNGLQVESCFMIKASVVYYVFLFRTQFVKIHLSTSLSRIFKLNNMLI